MTKKWSSTRSDLLKTKRQASKDARRAVDAEVEKAIKSIQAGDYEEVDIDTADG